MTATSKTIYQSLVSAQKNFESAAKTSNNPHFRSKYAALDVCVDAVKEALNNEGIFLLQKTHECTDGVMLETIFIHESGEQLSGGVLHVPASKHDAQGYGSALTYARRYSLLAACGIAPEDDDGNAATKAPPKAIKQPSEQEVATKLKEVTEKMIFATTTDQLRKELDVGREWAKLYGLPKFNNHIVELSRDLANELINKEA
jgi:hypothetical protein